MQPQPSNLERAARPSFPTCGRCQVYMVKRDVEVVPGPNGAMVTVQIFECPSCDKLGAQEIASAPNEDSRETA
jgi:hypothetical protein